MDQILTDLGLEQLIPAFVQHKITVQNFDYLLKNNCPGGPLQMIMDQTGLAIGDFLTIMEKIESSKTSQNPFVQKHMFQHNTFQQRQSYPKSTNLTSSYGRKNRITKLLTEKPQPRAYQSMTKMMPKSQQNGSNLDSFLGIDNRQNSSRKDSMNPFDQRNMHPRYPKQASMMVKEEQQAQAEQESEESVQIQEVVHAKQEHHQSQDFKNANEPVSQENQNTGQIESIVENTITEEEKQILQNKASQDYLHEKLKSLSQQQDGLSEDHNNHERKFIPRKISSPDYEPSNMSDQFQNAVKMPDQKTFENNAPIPNDNKDAFDCDDSQEYDHDKEDLVDEAARMMKAAQENAAKETTKQDVEDQESYSEVANDKDHQPEKYVPEPHNQQISTNVQFNLVSQQQRQELHEDTSELDEDDEESNSQISDEKPNFNPNSAFNRRPAPQVTNGQQSQHQSRPTIGVKQPCSFNYRNQLSGHDELAKLQRQMEEKQMEIRKMQEQQNAINTKEAKMSDHGNEESSLESLEEPKQQQAQKVKEPLAKNDDQVSEDSYGTEQDEEMEIVKPNQENVQNAQAREGGNIDDDDEDLPSDSEFNKKAEQRKAEVTKNIARQSQWATGHIVAPQQPSHDQNAFSSQNPQYFEDSPSEENFASQIHAENLQRSQQEQQQQQQQQQADLMQQCKMTSENTNTFLVGTSESQNNFYNPQTDVLKQPQPQQKSQLISSGQKFDNPIMVDQPSSSFAQQQSLQENFNLNLVQMQNTLTSQNSVKQHQSQMSYQNQQTVISPQKVMQPLHPQVVSSSILMRSGNEIQRPNILQSELQERNSMLQQNDECDPHQQIMSEIKQSQNFQEFQAPQQFSTNIHNQIASSYNSSSAIKHNMNTSQQMEQPSQCSAIMKYDQYAQIDIKPKQQDMQVQNELLTPDHVINLKLQLRSELRSEVQEEVRAELHQQVQQEVMSKVRQQVEYEITSQVTERVTNEVSQRVKMQVEQEKQHQLQIQIQEIKARICEEERNKFENEKSEQQRRLQEFQSSLQSEKAKFHEIIQQKENQISQFKTQEESNQTLVQRLNESLNRLNDEKLRADQNVQYLQSELEKEKQAKLYEAQQAQLAQQKADQEKARLEALERKRLDDEAEQQRRQQEAHALIQIKEAEAAALKQKLEEQQRLQKLEQIEAQKRQQEIYNQQILEKQRIEAAIKEKEEAERLKREAFEERQRQEQERQKEEAAARLEAMRQQAAKQEAIKQENMRKQKEEEMAILKRQQQEQAAAIQKRLEEEAAQRRVEEEHARKEAELHHLQELKRKAEEEMRRVQEENLRIQKQQQEELELKRQQMIELQKQKEQAELEERQRIEEQEKLKKQAEMEAAQQEKRKMEEELIEQQRLEGQKMLVEKEKQEKEFQMRMLQEQESMRQLQEKQEQLKILIEEKEKREEEERKAKAEQLALSNENQSQEVLTHSSMIKAQQEMLLDLEQKKLKLEKENQQMQEKLQRSSQMSQLSDKKSVSENLDHSQTGKDVNVINLDEDLEEQQISPSKQKYFQQLREESSFLPDVVKVQKEKKKIIKKVRFHDYPASADKDSASDDDNDSDFQVKVSPKKRKFIDRLDDPEEQEFNEEDFEEDCDKDFERLQQKQMNQKRLRSSGMSSDQEKQDNSFVSENTTTRRRLNKKFIEDDAAVSAEEAPKKPQVKRKQKQVRKSTGTSKSTSPTPTCVSSQLESSYSKPKKSSSQKKYDQKIIQHIEKAENPGLKQNKHLMGMLMKIAAKK